MKRPKSNFDNPDTLLAIFGPLLLIAFLVGVVVAYLHQSQWVVAAPTTKIINPIERSLEP